MELARARLLTKTQITHAIRALPPRSRSAVRRRVVVLGTIWATGRATVVRRLSVAATWADKPSTNGLVCRVVHVDSNPEPAD